MQLPCLCFICLCSFVADCLTPLQERAPWQQTFNPGVRLLMRIWKNGKRSCSGSTNLAAITNTQFLKACLTSCYTLFGLELWICHIFGASVSACGKVELTLIQNKIAHVLTCSKSACCLNERVACC